MERAAALKMVFLLALLVLGSCWSRGIEGKVECIGAPDCIDRCNGCTTNKCLEGHCFCGCGLSLEAYSEPPQCATGKDCISICGGCLVNQCTAGRCVCGC